MSTEPVGEDFVLSVLDVFDLTDLGVVVVGPIESGVARTGDLLELTRGDRVVATATAQVELINARRADPRSIALVLLDLDGERPLVGDVVRGSATTA